MRQKKVFQGHITGAYPDLTGIEIDCFGKFVFGFSRMLQRSAFARRAIWEMVCKEQHMAGGQRRMSMVLWDTFTGSAPYRDVLLRTFHPAFWGRLLWEMVAANRGVHARAGGES
jgi:hypothetical protein